MKYIAFLILCLPAFSAEPIFPVSHYNVPIPESLSGAKSSLSGPSKMDLILDKMDSISNRLDAIEGNSSVSKDPVPPVPGDMVSKPTVTTKTVHVMMHDHTCRHCGTTWSHTDANNGSTSAHTCPKCGHLQFNQSRGNHSVAVTQTVRQPIQTSVQSAPAVRVQASGGCPNGNCPTSGRIMRRWFK